MKKQKGSLAKEYVVPKSWVKISPPKKYNLTDERREAMRQQMLLLHTDDTSAKEKK